MARNPSNVVRFPGKRGKTGLNPTSQVPCREDVLDTALERFVLRAWVAMVAAFPFLVLLLAVDWSALLADLSR